jgi:hypothetical protein
MAKKRTPQQRIAKEEQHIINIDRALADCDHLIAAINNLIDEQKTVLVESQVAFSQLEDAMSDPVLNTYLEEHNAVLRIQKRLVALRKNAVDRGKRAINAVAGK